MFSRIPANVVWRVNTIAISISHECFIAEAYILSKRIVTIGQAVILNSIALQYLFDISTHLKPIIFGVLNRDIEPEISSKSAFLELGIILD